MYMYMHVFVFEYIKPIKQASKSKCFSIIPFQNHKFYIHNLMQHHFYLVPHFFHRKYTYIFIESILAK